MDAELEIGRDVMGPLDAVRPARPTPLRIRGRHELNDFDSDSESIDEPPGHDAIVLFAVFFEGGLAPLSLILGWFLNRPPLLHFSWSAGDALIGAAAAIPPVLFFLAMLRWPFGPFAGLKRFIDDEFVPLLVNSTWSDIALIAISAGVGEEMLFRGVFQSALIGSTGLVAGLILASLLFGLLHPISILYATVGFAMGIYLGGLFLITDNLLAAMMAHAVYDFLLMAYLLRIHDPNRPRENPIAAIDSDHEIDSYKPHR